MYLYELASINPHYTYYTQHTTNFEISSIIHNSNQAIIACLNWNKNGNFLCAGNGNLVKIFDIRKMAEVEVLKGHNNVINSIKWHPVHESLLLSGCYDGSMAYWMMGHKVRGGERGVIMMT